MSYTRRLIPLLILAIAGIGYAAWTAQRTVRREAVPPLPQTPPERPYRDRVAATGLIETRDEDTLVGVPETGVVAEVGVAVGDRVVPGQLLFRLDDRTLRAELATRRIEEEAAEAELITAQAHLRRLQALPRREDALPFEAQVRVAEEALADAQRHLARSERLVAGASTTFAERDLRRGNAAIASRMFQRAQADLTHAQLAAWEPDVAIARAAVTAAQAGIRMAAARSGAIEARLQTFQIRSPRHAIVLNVNVTAGYSAVPGERHLMRLGDADHLRIRVEVDESQARRINPAAPGTGWVRGDGDHCVSLSFVRIEPLAEERRSLPGAPGERLDARSVQVLYDIERPPPHLRPGMLLEVDLATDALARDHPRVPEHIAIP